ncbi:AbrB/MazE/SpoVT family DNA-binding domain-containing protein [Paucibacter sp. O1-1]|nr:AbrB/MazE/SpoVT family DNA-binding domain-containing protein [Paucibacter sp. O1-1]MDA3829754.1 AbrB/MazE/SpoVT family DNA-binding domain-containing protein [Paucibacter sp. O1-1]
MLAKITSKNQLTLPKSVTQALGPVQYFEVQEKAGQIILTPVRIQRGDALRAKLAELSIDEKTLDAALDWAQKAAAKPLSAKKTAAAKKPAVKKLVTRKTTAAKKPSSAARPAVKTVSKRKTAR